MHYADKARKRNLKIISSSLVPSQVCYYQVNILRCFFYATDKKSLKSFGKAQKKQTKKTLRASVRYNLVLIIFILNSNRKTDRHGESYTHRQA